MLCAYFYALDMHCVYAYSCAYCGFMHIIELKHSYLRFEPYRPNLGFGSEM